MVMKQMRHYAEALSQWASSGDRSPVDGRSRRCVLRLELLEARNLLSFGPPVNYFVPSGPEYIGVGDFRGVGTQDLAVAGFDTLSILLGNGDGTFQAPVDYPAGEYAKGIVAADFNGDGNLDLAVTTESGINNGAGTVSVYFGNGDGTFRKPVDYQVGQYPVGLATADFDLDGRPDLAFVATTAGAVGILLNNGDGTFQPPIYTFVGGSLTSIGVGDFNGDGIPDVALADGHDDSLSILLGNGDGTFQAARKYYTPGKNPISLAVGHFTGDGALDVVAANQVTHLLSVFLNNGDGTFQPAVYYSTGDVYVWANSVAVGDFNDDGNLDFVTANGITRDVSVLLGNGDGTFQNALRYPADVYPSSVTVADFNGDNYPDLAVADEVDGTFSVLLNQADWDMAPLTRTAATGSASAKARLVLPATSSADTVAAQPATAEADSRAVALTTPAGTDMIATSTTSGPMVPAFVTRAGFLPWPHLPADDLIFNNLDPTTALK
jgi:hypothetical protein